MDEEEFAESEPKKKSDPLALAMYGETFQGYQKVGEIKETISAFKDYYYERKKENVNATLFDIMQTFNREICTPEGKRFHPYPSQVKFWRAKWDADIISQLHGAEMAIVEPKKIRQIIKTRNEDREVVLGAPQDSDLEAGVRTLGGELLNDAMQMLRDDQMLEEVMDDEVVVKRRKYIVDVFAHVTRLVHGKAALMLKASEEKRNNATFLMTLLAKATSGKLSDEEMAMLETTYSPQNNEPRQPVNV